MEHSQKKKYLIKGRVKRFAQRMSIEFNMSFSDQKKFEAALLKQVEIFLSTKFNNMKEPETRQPKSMEELSEYQLMQKLRNEVNEIKKDDFPGRAYAQTSLEKMKRLAQLEEKFKKEIEGNKSTRPKAVPRWKQEVLTPSKSMTAEEYLGSKKLDHYFSHDTIEKEGEYVASENAYEAVRMARAEEQAKLKKTMDAEIKLQQAKLKEALDTILEIKRSKEADEASRMPRSEHQAKLKEIKDAILGIKCGNKYALDPNVWKGDIWNMALSRAIHLIDKHK